MYFGKYYLRLSTSKVSTVLNSEENFYEIMLK